MTKETYIYDKRDLHIWQKRPTYMTKETYIYGKRDCHIWPKSPTYVAHICRRPRGLQLQISLGMHMSHITQKHRYDTRHVHTWQKVSYIHDKRDLHKWIVSRRHGCATKETYRYDKRDPHVWHTWSTYMTKETYKYEWYHADVDMGQDKRDLHIWQKRPTYMTKEAFFDIHWSLWSLCHICRPLLSYMQDLFSHICRSLLSHM